MLFFLLLLAFCTSSALCTIQITIPGQINANSNIVANWTRDPSDPIPKLVQKVKQDELNGSLASQPIKFFSKHATKEDKSTLSGNVTIPFNRAGIFYLQVFDDHDSVIATSRPFGVNPPTSFQVNTAQQLVTGVLADSSSPQPANNPNNHTQPSPAAPSAKVMGSTDGDDDHDDGGKHKDKDHKSSKSSLSPALTAAVVVVSVFLFISMTAILFYFLRKRLRRQRYLRERKAVQESFAPSLMTSGQVSRNVTAIGTTGYNDLEKAQPYEDSPSVRRFSIFSGSRSSYFTSNAATEEGPQKRRRSFPSIVRTSGTISTIQFNPQTERQIALEERIWELEEQMERLRKEDTDGSGPPTDNDLRLWKLKGQIESMRNYKESAWALGMTDDMPPGLSLR